MDLEGKRRSPGCPAGAPLWQQHGSRDQIRDFEKKESGKRGCAAARATAGYNGGNACPLGT